MTDDEGEKCPWCSIHLREDRSCPNPAHPGLCPFCGTALKNTPPLHCPKDFCASNAVRPTLIHSSFPPSVVRVATEGSRTLRRDLDLYGYFLHVRFPEFGSDAEEDDQTNPAIPITHPSLHPSACNVDSPPPTRREGSRSGVYPSACTSTNAKSSKTGS